MKHSDKQVNLLRFLQNGNVILIRNDKEFERFRGCMLRHGLETLMHGWAQTYPTQVFQTIKFNGGDRLIKSTEWDGKTFYAECQIGKESIGIYPHTVRATVEWYGTEPMSIDDIDDIGPSPTVTAKVAYYRWGREGEKFAWYDLPELGERVFDAATVLNKFDDGTLEELYESEFPISSTLDSWLAGFADELVDDAEKLGLVAKRPDGALVRVWLDDDELEEYLIFRGIIEEEDC